MAVTKCAAAFAAFLTRRSEHLDQEILRDWHPSDDAWVGHVATGQFKAFDGVSHTYDRMHVAFPDLSGCRTAVDNTNCVGTPCDFDEKEIGYGMDRFSYSLTRESYTSPLICWDQNLTIDQAIEKWGIYVEGLKKATRIINSNHFKLEGLRGAGTIYICGQAGATVSVSLNADCTELNTGGVYPTSILQLPYLMKFVEPLTLEGYFKQKTQRVPMFKLITDLTALRDLQVANPTLANQWQFSDFTDANGQFYKYGAVAGVGNFLIAVDDFPMRFVKKSDGNLKRIFPYENVSATTGIKPEVSEAYMEATYQLSPIWHEQAMKILTMDARPLHKDMPFLIRDFAGKWRFAMDNLVVHGCPVDNKRRNKGLFYADFESATKYERPELVRWVLHRRQTMCVTDIAPCAEQSGYPTQDYNSANEPCPTPVLTFTPTPSGGPFSIAANTATCNGVPVVHSAVSGANLAALAADLNSKLPTLGTWAVSGSNITLSDSTCSSVTLTFS